MKEKQALCQIGHLEAGDPAALGAHLGSLARRFPHIDVWGGCCGTWDDHLRAAARELRPLETAV
jgi:methionine synthase I (cobalamin-dependent)